MRHSLIPTRLVSTKPESRVIKSGDCISGFDVAIVGGGIVGLATARNLKIRHSSLKMCVLEKEILLSTHQSGHNSGVIHAGIYYVPGSLKAKLCVEGLKQSYIYCDEKHIPYKKVGKLIVATTPTEVDRLSDLMKRGQANGVPDLRIVDAAGIKEIEPNCVGLKAIHSPHTGIVDWRVVALSYGVDFQKLGGDIFTEFEVAEFRESVDKTEYPVTLSTATNQLVHCKYVVVCGGLHADRLALKSGAAAVPKIVPFRGDYLILRPEKRGLVNGNIYPVPDPRFPFLGVHFTPRIDGEVWLGPNAVLAFKREGYGLRDFSLRDTVDALSYSGMRRIAIKFFGVGVKEMINVAFMSQQVKSLQRFVPSLRLSDVCRGPSGVRAQALGPDGSLVDDFVFHEGAGPIGGRLLHVRNAPSPAATSSLTIAAMIADKADKDFKL